MQWHATRIQAAEAVTAARAAGAAAEAGAEAEAGARLAAPRGLAALAAAVGAADAALASRLPRLDTAGWRVSVIVPVLNEAKGIRETLDALQRLDPPPHEIIVVDGGSTDGTRRLARRKGVRVLAAARRGRAAQMNEGASAAAGELLAFVHADTRPPGGMVSALRAAFTDPKTLVAGFKTNIEVPGRRLHLMTAHNTHKTWGAPLFFRPLSFARGLRCLFGDQSIACRKTDFRRLGGYDERWRIMEARAAWRYDSQFCIDMHMMGPEWPPAAAGGNSSSSSSSGSRSKPNGSGRKPSSSSGGGGPAAAAAPLHGLFPGRPRGRVLFITDRVATTSGRRLAAWGPVRATLIHLAISLSWYVTQDTRRVEQLYERLYTDLYR
ncbi:MAG: nucleotide-diphospho-sugar transferase [Monoraphidium minutum]|nr:MAG: nucleotide-diphospho-sugar transferase [Monoraphidium minutum]